MTQLPIPTAQEPVLDAKTGHVRPPWFQFFDGLRKLVAAAEKNIAAISFDGLSPTTTEGDLIVRGAAGDEALPAGTEGHVLTAQGAGQKPVYAEVAVGWTTVFKAADQIKNSDTTLADDAELQFPVAANTTYAFRLNVFYGSASVPDFKFQIVGPASPTLAQFAYTAMRGDGALVTAQAQAFAAAQVLAHGALFAGWLAIEGIIQNGANAGTVALQWAQNTSNAGATAIRGGSYLEYKKL